MNLLSHGYTKFLCILESDEIHYTQHTKMERAILIKILNPHIKISKICAYYKMLKFIANRILK